MGQEADPVKVCVLQDHLHDFGVFRDYPVLARDYITILSYVVSDFGVCTIINYRAKKG